MDPTIFKSTHLSNVMCYNAYFCVFIPKCSDDGDELQKQMNLLACSFGFVVLTTVTVRSIVFWDVTPALLSRM
jgi:hypothetical protein